MERIFAGVQRDWLDILVDEKSGCRKMLFTIIDDLLTKSEAGIKITPPLDKILEFARTPFKRTIVVAIGQDPYPTMGDANGLAFSSDAPKCPASVQRIFGAMVQSGVLKEIPKKWNLSHWAAQGILMMNTAWTTEVGIANAHCNLWSDYTYIVFRLISERSKNNIHWMLWGDHAKAREKVIDTKRHIVLKWCHPVAMTSPSFKHCDHFAIVQKAHPQIVWHFDPIDTLWYTDATCKNNQSAAKARGAWGALCRRGPYAGGKWGGALPQSTDVPFRGGIEKARPTNIRGEGIAVMFVLNMIIKTGVRGRHTIVSDSKFWIEDMLAGYMPSWVERKIPWTDKKNSDITSRMWTLWTKAKALGAEFRFTNAWHDYTPKDSEREDWEGNRDVEAVAESYLSQTTDAVKIETKSS